MKQLRIKLCQDLLRKEQLHPASKVEWMTDTPLSPYICTGHQTAASRCKELNKSMLPSSNLDVMHSTAS